MSAINLIALENVLIFPRPACACVCPVEATAILPLASPLVSRRWVVEINIDGTRRLVARWFKNEDAP